MPFILPFILALLASRHLAHDGTALAAPGDREAPARALPQQVVICVDRASARCWSATSEEQCRTAAGAEVFRALPRGEGSVAHGPALADCWTSVGTPRTP